MKKHFLIVFVLLAISSINAQRYLIIADSMTQKTQTSKTYYLGRYYPLVHITATDTGTALTDTIMVETGTIRYNYYAPTTKMDTVWKKVQVRDSTNAMRDYIIAPGINSYWIVWSWYPELIRLSWLQTPWKTGRKWNFILEGVSER